MPKEEEPKINLRHLLVWKLLKSFNYYEFNFLNLDEVVNWLHEQVDQINLFAQIYYSPPTRETVIKWCREYRREKMVSMFSDGIRVIVTARATLQRVLPPGYTPPNNGAT